MTFSHKLTPGDLYLMLVRSYEVQLAVWVIQDRESKFKHLLQEIRKTPHWRQFVRFVFQLQMAADWTWNSAYSGSRQVEQYWGWWDEGWYFSRFTTHFLLSVHGRSAWTNSFNSQDSAWNKCYHSSFMGRSSERLSELSKATQSQNCATFLSSASPSQGDHGKQ